MLNPNFLTSNRMCDFNEPREEAREEKEDAGSVAAVAKVTNAGATTT